MTDNELDNLFKNTLSNHEAPVPTDMWERIQPSERKRRPVVLWWNWYAAAAVFLIAGMATWWYLGTSPVKNQNTATNNTTQNKEDKQQIAVDSNKGSNDTISAKQNNIAANGNGASHNQEKTSNKKTTASLNAAASEKYSRNASVMKTGKVQQENNFSSSISNQQNNIPANNNQETVTNKNANDDNSSQAKTQALSGTPQIEKENTKGAVVSDTAKENSLSKNNTAAANTKKDGKKVKHPWTIELYGTSAYADKQTYDVVKENTIGIAAPIPQPQPKPSLWNYNAGLRIGIPVSKKLSLKTGIQFSQTRQKANYQQQSLVDMVSVNGFGDTSFYRQIVYQPEKQQSTYNSLSVPVLISYQTGKKIKIGAIAGAIVNAYSWYNGNVPNATYSETLDAKSTYKNNTGVALYAGISIAKKVGKVEIFAEPNLQYSLSSFTKKTVPFKQKINTYGLSIGVRTALHK